MARIAALAVALLAASGASSSAAVNVKRGVGYGTRIFPSNAFTVRDKAQLTGMRVHFRLGRDYPNVGGRVRKNCTSTPYSICDSFRELNKLDGFDLQPRVTVPFTGSIRLGSVNAMEFVITTGSGTVAGGLEKDRVFRADAVAPSVSGPLDGMVRADQVKADPKAPAAFESRAVPNLIPPGSAGYFAFGWFSSPRYQYHQAGFHHDNPTGKTEGEIPPVPTKLTPKVLGDSRLGVIAVTPDPVRFPPPWPAAVYGPGFTRSDYDIFVSADYNASRGILTIATDPAGHGYGPQSTTTVTAAGVSTTFHSFGRGRDLDGDGTIGDGLNDGVGPTGHTPAGGGAELPSHKPLDGLQSGLVQTVVDNMALGRALKRGLDIPGVGNNLVDPSRIMYYGISFG